MAFNTRIISTALLLAVLPFHIKAAVIVSTLQGNTDAGGSSVTLNDFALNAGDDSVLIVAFAGETLAGAPALTVDGSSAGVTTLANVSAANSSTTQNSIFGFALGDVGGGATIDLELTNTDADGGYMIFQLTGAVQTFTLGTTYWSGTDETNTAVVSADLNGVSAGSAVVAFVASENGNLGSGGFTSSGTDSLGTFPSVDWGSASGAGTFLEDQSGDLNFGMTFGGQTGNNRELVFTTVAVAAIPEPSSMALSGLALCAVLLIRRRKS